MLFIRFFLANAKIMLFLFLYGTMKASLTFLYIDLLRLSLRNFTNARANVCTYDKRKAMADGSLDSRSAVYIFLCSQEL